VAQARAEKVDGELRVRELELQIRQSDAEIKNLEGKLAVIKNNAEYQAILFQIEAVKRERDTYEEETLGLLDKAGPMEEALKRAEEAVVSEEAVFQKFKTESVKLLVSQEAEIAAIACGRDALLEGIPSDLIDEYNRLFQVRENLAICRAESQYCQGCYTQFTMNDLARLQGGRAIVRCSSCQRILFLDD
jgi:predicted  nucleic acid-binding Zn-ribbon protein